MCALAIIPARYGSSRFPGKALTPIAGKPMIQHVWERTRLAKHVDAVIIATDDQRIRSSCEAFGATVEMTAATHPTGTDRLAEVASRHKHEIIVNVQGDEPLIEAFVIDRAIETLFRDDRASISTIVHRVEPAAFNDPNRVKVVVDSTGAALYFSRSAIPHPRANTNLGPLQHVGLYVYRRDFLLEFTRLPQSPAEIAEGLEQLRALENGYRVAAAEIEGWTSIPVDVPEDVAVVEAVLRRSVERSKGLDPTD
jgi:3-deoxy-manno-octulosonate cytidylyltransferase (CMP-KDO synthetase)